MFMIVVIIMSMVIHISISHIYIYIVKTRITAPAHRSVQIFALQKGAAPQFDKSVRQLSSISHPSKLHNVKRWAMPHKNDEACPRFCPKLLLLQSKHGQGSFAFEPTSGQVSGNDVLTLLLSIDLLFEFLQQFCFYGENL